MKKMIIYKDEKYIVRYLWSAELFMFSSFSIAFIISKNVAVWFNSNNNGNSSHSVMAYVQTLDVLGILHAAHYSPLQ